MDRGQRRDRVCGSARTHSGRNTAGREPFLFHPQRDETFQHGNATTNGLATVPIVPMHRSWATAHRSPRNRTLGAATSSVEGRISCDGAAGRQASAKLTRSTQRDRCPVRSPQHRPVATHRRANVQQFACCLPKPRLFAPGAAPRSRDDVTARTTYIRARFFWSTFF